MLLGLINTGFMVTSQAYLKVKLKPEVESVTSVPQYLSFDQKIHALLLICLEIVSKNSLIYRLCPHKLRSPYGRQ